MTTTMDTDDNALQMFAVQHIVNCPHLTDAHLAADSLVVDGMLSFPSIEYHHHQINL